MKILHSLSAVALIITSTSISPLFAQAATEAQPEAEEPLVVDPMASARDAMARGDPAEALARYLRVLARDPSDLEALSGAGSAALAVGDADAAINFYVRAEKVAPRDGRIKAGLGSALVQKEQPRAALRLFDDAVGLGVAPQDVALDRGLAYDLRGDNRKAQSEYLALLRVRPDPEATRRLALSLAMMGERAGALSILDPLLRKKDVAAWRARAFVLAMTGDLAGAEGAAYQVLPRYQADALKPFLERLSSLKPAEKAAAVHFGHFPEDKVPAEAVAAIPATNAAKAGTAPPVVVENVIEPTGPTDQAAEDARSLAQDRRAAQRHAAAERAAAEKKVKAKEEAKARKSNPERHWVQIASGSFKPDLDKEWDKQKDRYGKMLSGRSPWTTPYKKTNRLLIGPFSSKGAAQDFVNDARDKGLSCFPVTTSAGERVERLN
jgi:Flp pilus assembly protein TadD